MTKAQLPAEARRLDDDATPGATRDTPTAQLVATLMRLASDPTLDTDKLRAVYDMQRDMIERDAREAFEADMRALQRDLPTVQKTGTIRSKTGEVLATFASYDTLHRIVNPLAQGYGFRFDFQMQPSPDGVAVQCTVYHERGHSKPTGFMPVPKEASGFKNAAQAHGSALSYGKRYALCCAFNILIAGEDDDANGTGKRRSAAPPSLDTEALQADAFKAADRGEYSKTFWPKLPQAARGWLIDEGLHDELKARDREIDGSGGG